MTGIDRRRQQVSLEEQTEILGLHRLGRHYPDEYEIPTVMIKGREFLVPALGDKLELIMHVCVHATGSSTVDEPVMELAPEFTPDDLVDALRLLQEVRIEVDRLELGLLQALSDLGVPDDRAAEARRSSPEDIAPYRAQLRADEQIRRPAALTKRWGQVDPDAEVDEDPPER